MTATAKTLQDVAGEARSWFERGEREAEGIGKILLPKDGRPEWVEDMTRAAHDDCKILPDDWRYEFIGDALDHLANLEDDSDPRDTFCEWFDGAYIYTHQQTAWLASSCERSGYCDEAREDYGASLDTMQGIMLGMLREAEEVFEVVLRACGERLEDETEEA